VVVILSAGPAGAGAAGASTGVGVDVSTGAGVGASVVGDGDAGSIVDVEVGVSEAGTPAVVGGNALPQPAADAMSRQPRSDMARAAKAALMEDRHGE
jgi:hypothetical protein